jgi:hypothetical protein
MFHEAFEAAVLRKHLLANLCNASTIRSSTIVMAPGVQTRLDVDAGLHHREGIAAMDATEVNVNR